MPSEFWDMTYKEIVLAIRGYEKRELGEWERTRLIAYQVYAGIPKKKGESNKPIYSYLPLPSDGQKANRMTKESYEETRQIFLNKLKEKSKQNN